MQGDEAPPEQAPETAPPPVDDMDTSRNSKSGLSQTSKLSIGSKSKSASVLLPVDPSILHLVSSVRNDPEEEEDLASQNCCRRNYHLFLCSCCDLVMACYIANAIYFCILIFLIVFWFTWEEMGVDVSMYGDDDYTQKQIMQYGETTVIRSPIGMVFALVGIAGAYLKNKWLVLSFVIWLIIYLAWAVVGIRYFSAIFAGIILYPNGFLFLALFNGKITSQNYESVKQCCPKKKEEATTTVKTIDEGDATP